jgi:hypothetical protein
MTRRELSDDGATWNIPGSRTKAGRAHTVPLSPLVRELIASVKAKPDSPFIFTTTGTTPVSGRRLRRIASRRRCSRPPARRATRPSTWTLHDLRRTLVTGMVELHVPPQVVELFPALGLAWPAPATARSELLPEGKAALERPAMAPRAEAEVMDARLKTRRIRGPSQEKNASLRRY